MAATGTYTDHSTQDLTTASSRSVPPRPQWQRSATLPALKASQLPASIGSGTIITASLGAVSGTTTLSVERRRAIIHPGHREQPFDRRGRPDSGIRGHRNLHRCIDAAARATQVTWSSSAPTVLRSSATRLALSRRRHCSVGVGTTTITADVEGLLPGRLALDVDAGNLGVDHGHSADSRSYSISQGSQQMVASRQLQRRIDPGFDHKRHLELVRAGRSCDRSTLRPRDSQLYRPHTSVALRSRQPWAPSRAQRHADCERDALVTSIAVTLEMPAERQRYLAHRRRS